MAIRPYVKIFEKIEIGEKYVFINIQKGNKWKRQYFWDKRENKIKQVVASKSFDQHVVKVCDTRKESDKSQSL